MRMNTTSVMLVLPLCMTTPYTIISLYDNFFFLSDLVLYDKELISGRSVSSSMLFIHACTMKRLSLYAAVCILSVVCISHGLTKLVNIVRRSLLVGENVPSRFYIFLFLSIYNQTVYTLVTPPGKIKSHEMDK